MNGAPIGSLRTTCPYCGVGCGIRPTVRRGRLAAVAGDEAHPANRGRLCVKGSALPDTQQLQGRLLEPRVRGRAASWEHALDAVAAGFSEAISCHGPDSVAFYLSGQLLTEDYYVANKLMKGFLGSPHVDTNSRLCMASAVAAHQRAFGEDVVPCDYDDLEHCELLVLVGSNLAWAHPVLFQRVAARHARGELRVVVVDPRRTPTCEIADLHLALRPGSDVALFNRLFTHLADAGAVDADWLEAHTEGFGAALAAARADAARASSLCGLDAEDLARFCAWFAASPRTVTLFSQGVNQSESGTDKANAIINCHLATGRIGRAGMGPFSITGQPNAMGGREVGGMASTLAAHAGYAAADVDRVRRFWKAPRMADREGRKAVDLFRAVADGEVRAIWIMGTNPVVSLPDADRVRAALEDCPLVVVSDCMALTDTTACADVLLPALGWGEKDGTVTNSERRISRQRAFLPAPGSARADWWIVCQVAARLGFGDAFAYTRPHQIFQEHAALSGFENGGRRLFDISALAHGSATDYDAMEPVQWPCPDAPGASRRPFAEGRFPRTGGRARLVAVRYRPPRQQVGRTRPLVLNTGRLRDQWHTMTRTGNTPRLFGHADLPTIHAHPLDAAAHELADGDLAELASPRGRLRGILQVEDAMPPGQVFVPMHWNERFSGCARVGVLLEPVVDPISGQPESKHGAVSVRRCEVALWLRLVSRVPVPRSLLEPLAFWADIPAPGGRRYELAVASVPAAAALLDAVRHLVPGGNAISYADRAWGDHRLLVEWDGICGLALFAHRQRASLPPATALLELMTAAAGVPPWRRLSGPASGSANASRTVCTCFEVSETAIRDAIAGGAGNAEALGLALRCGTNCGSCLPELNAMIAGASAGGRVEGAR